MFTRTFTTSSPVRTSVTRVGTTRTVFSPARQMTTTVHRPSTTIVTSPVRRSVTVTSPLRATSTITQTHGILERARPVIDPLGLTRSRTIVKGALPTMKTYGQPVEINDTGIFSPVRPTTVTRLAPGTTSTFIHSSPIRRSVTYANPATSTTVTTNHIPSSPVRVTSTGPEIHESTTVYSPTRVTATTMSPGRVVTNRIVSPGRTITEHAPRYIGSNHMATSTFIPAPAPVNTTTVTTTNVPRTSITRTSVITSQEGTALQTGNITGNTYASRVYSPTRRIAALTTSPSRVRIDRGGIHETYDPTITTTTSYF